MAETFAQAQTRYAAWQQIKDRAGLTIVDARLPYSRTAPNFRPGDAWRIIELTQAICEGLPVLSDTEVEQEAQRCAVELLRNRVQQLEAAIALHVDACAKPIAFDPVVEAQREAALVAADETLRVALNHGWPWTK